MPPLDVVHVVNSMASGGAERNLYDLALHLDPERYASRILCLYRIGELGEELRERGVEVEALCAPHALRRPACRAVRTALARRPADVVNTHSPEAAWLGLPAARLAGIPVRVSHLQNCHWRWPAKLRVLDRAAFGAGGATAIAVSGAVREFYERRLHYPSRRLIVIPNAVDVGRFERDDGAGGSVRARLGIDPAARVLVTVASLTEQKGHSHLIAALPAVTRRFDDVTWLVVGEGPLRRRLESEAARHGVAGHVRFLGRRADVPDLLAAADILVLPSLWEGLPVAVAEAAAAARPVVASAVDGTREVVRHGETGLLVRPADPAALAKAVAELFADPDRARRMGDAGRRLVREQFNVKVTARRIGAVYDAQVTTRERGGTGA